MSFKVSSADYGKDGSPADLDGSEIPAGPGDIADLRRYLRRRMRDPADIDDMIQDVYLRVLSAPQGGIIENARGFLRRIASNLLRNL